MTEATTTLTRADSGQLQTVMDEIVIQSKVEFNYNDDDEDENGAEEVSLLDL